MIRPGRLPEGQPTHPVEPHGGTAGSLNWLRVAVLGANDGIVSVAGARHRGGERHIFPRPSFTAGLAGLAAGAVSTAALGEAVADTPAMSNGEGHGGLGEGPNWGARGAAED